MAYTLKDWKHRVGLRGDLTSRLTHLTRGADGKSAVQILVEILTTQTLRGSTTDSGFIVGDRPAVCFQDAPMAGIAQNLWFEQDLRAKTLSAKVRYDSVGLALPKEFVFRKGGLPVIYGPTDDQKAKINISEWWRLVRLDYKDSENVVDWTHEREWRVPDQLTFDRKSAVVVFGKSDAYKSFIDLARAETSCDLLKEIRGIVNLEIVYW